MMKIAALTSGRNTPSTRFRSGKLTGSLEDKEWYEYRRNGAYTIHRPGLLNDKDFQDALESVMKKGAFDMDRPLANIGCTFYGN